MSTYISIYLAIFLSGYRSIHLSNYISIYIGLTYSLKASKYGMEILVRGHDTVQTLKLISELLDQIYGQDFKEVFYK